MNQPPKNKRLIQEFESAEKALAAYQEIEEINEKQMATFVSSEQTPLVMIEEIVIWRKDPHSFSEKKNSFLLTRSIKGQFEESLKSLNNELHILFDWKVDLLTQVHQKYFEEILSILNFKNKDNSKLSSNKKFKIIIEQSSDHFFVNIFWECPLERIVERHQSLKTIMSIKARYEEKGLRITFVHNKPLADLSEVLGIGFQFNLGIQSVLKGNFKKDLTL